MQIKIHHVSLLVSSTPRALQFYVDLLGLSVDTKRPDLGYPGAWLVIGEKQIHLLELPDPDANSIRPEHGGRDRHLAMLIDDIQLLEKKLKAAGIDFTRSKSGRLALFCRDPDDNALEFIQG